MRPVSALVARAIAVHLLLVVFRATCPVPTLHLHPHHPTTHKEMNSRRSSMSSMPLLDPCLCPTSSLSLSRAYRHPRLSFAPYSIRPSSPCPHPSPKHIHSQDKKKYSAIAPASTLSHFLLHPFHHPMQPQPWGQEEEGPTASIVQEPPPPSLPSSSSSFSHPPQPSEAATVSPLLLHLKMPLLCGICHSSISRRPGKSF